MLWCQTIARLCGGENQLHQKLPHFGEEGSGELLDFIDFMSRDNDDTDTSNKMIHRRIKSRVNLAQLGDIMKGHAHTPGHRRKPSATSAFPSRRSSTGVAVLGGAQDKDSSLGGRRHRQSASVTFSIDGEAEKDKGSASDVELGLSI